MTKILISVVLIDTCGDQASRTFSTMKGLVVLKLTSRKYGI